MLIKIKKNSGKSLKNGLIWLLTCFLFVSFCIWGEERWGSIIMLGITALILCIDAASSKGKYKPHFGAFHFYTLIWAIYCALTALWAISPEAAISKSFTVIKILICMTVLYSHYYERGTTKELWSCLLVSGYIISIYTFKFFGISSVINIVRTGGRLSNEYANVNTIGLLSAYSVTLIFYYILYKNISKVLVVSSVFPVIIIIATGSRKALVLMVMGVVVLFLGKGNKKNKIIRMIEVIFRIIILIIVLRWLFSLEIFEGINNRMLGLKAALTGKGAMDHSSFLRMSFKEKGMEVFKQNPVLGVGIGSSGEILKKTFWDTYFHDNYVEILACGGIIGIFVYYSRYIYLIKNYWKNRNILSEESFLCIIFIIFSLIMDYGMVSYYSKESYFYFMIFFLEIEFLKKKKQRNRGFGHKCR